MNYFTADLHLGHQNVIRLSQRPFSSIEEMDEALIKNWNRRITSKDDVYIVGDLCFRAHHDKMLHYLRQLDGKKHLIIGNHDRELITHADLRRQFVEITSYKEMSDNGHSLVLFHYPIVEWNGYYRDTIHLYGHIHNNYDNDTSKYIRGVKNAYNVGVDVLDYEPKTLEEIIALQK